MTTTPVLLEVEEVVAKAFGRPLAAVRRANLLRGDVGEVAVLAKHDALEGATLLFLGLLAPQGNGFHHDQAIDLWVAGLVDHAHGTAA